MTRRPRSSNLLQMFTAGSLGILVACLLIAAWSFSRTFVAREQERRAIAFDQLNHFFAFQYRSIAEEMWTRNFESIGIRVAAIGRDFGNAETRVILTDEAGRCLYATGFQGCPSASRLSSYIERGGVNAELGFDSKADNYLYTTRLMIGTASKGFLYAEVSDPYHFYQGDSVSFAVAAFLRTALGVLFVWLVWLVLSRRYLLRPYLRNEIELEKLAATSEMAAQLAHDIHSPLATLMTVVRNIGGNLPTTEAQLLKSAASRIQNLADGLLSRNQRVQGSDGLEFSFVSGVVHSIIAEKTAVLDPMQVRVTAKIQATAVRVGVPISTSDLLRVLSNLVNNSIEAARESHTLDVAISVRVLSNKVLIAVSDNGKGIPEEVLSRLRSVGGSYGKAQGRGIGLRHAKTICEAVQGSLELRSTLGEGTTVELALPLAAVPSWCVESLPFLPGDKIVVLDDDESVLLLWKEILRGCVVTPIKDPEEFNDLLFPKQDYWYIFDYDIAGSAVTGLDLVRTYNLAERAFLATSYFNDVSLQRRVAAANTKMLPKFLIPEMRLSQEESSESDETVLIDDSPMVRETWQYEADRLGLRFRAFESAQQFLVHVPSIPKSAAVYVDAQLGEGERGELVTKKLSELGYTNLYLATGQPPESFPTMPWIKGIIGKDFPQVRVSAKQKPEMFQ